MNTGAKIAMGLTCILLSCAPEAPQETTPTPQPEIVNFRLEQIQASPHWELTAKQAREQPNQTIEAQQLLLRLNTLPTPLELSSPVGQYQTPHLRLQGPVSFKQPPFQGTLSQALWSEKEGWSGKQVEIFSTHFHLRGEHITSAPPYHSLHLGQVSARFER